MEIVLFDFYNIHLTNKIQFLNYIILKEWWENSRY